MMQKHNIFTLVLYTTRPLQVFTTYINPILSVNKAKLFISYANCRTMIDKIADKYGDCLDQSDYLKLTGCMKKGGEVSRNTTVLWGSGSR